jgi:hypothetical protein
MTRVRPFKPDDIPQVADLIWRFLYGQEGSTPAALEYYLQQLFLLGPYADPDVPSFVYPDNRGVVVGFLGVVTRRMASTQGALRVAFGSNFIVRPSSRTTPASLQLAKSFLNGEQDLSLSDTANEASQLIWRGFGGVAVPMSDRHWSRPLRPGLYALRAVSPVGDGPLTGALIAACRPLCRLTDSVVSRVSVSPAHARGVRSVPFNEDILRAFLTQSSMGMPIRPVYEKHSLHWLLEFMCNAKARGSLRKVALRDEAGSIVGCYVYCAKQGEIGEVVFVGAEDAHFDRVFDHLLHDATMRGVIGLQGKLDSRVADRLSKRFCFFYGGRDPLLVHSREPDLTHLVQNGGLNLTRLDGEWCFKFGFGLAPRDCARRSPQVPDAARLELALRAFRS